MIVALDPDCASAD